MSAPHCLLLADDANTICCECGLHRAVGTDNCCHNDR
jgi:hypothetical protein